VKIPEEGEAGEMFLEAGAKAAAVRTAAELHELDRDAMPHYDGIVTGEVRAAKVTMNQGVMRRKADVRVLGKVYCLSKNLPGGKYNEKSKG
jgi:hypothetical protein